ncbi:MAG TPA: type II secretion system protein N [Terricaulis sp.]|mgnify:CR=1 FL=1|nr:type II secretion system protein N [Terricaulis sp.]HRP10021.1 type II secretion system protein N [Terricaulis sp.]
MRIWHFLVFAVALAAFALAFAPAAVFVAPREGFSYTRASGAIWNARIEGARLGGYSVDELAWRISPLDLVQGRVIAPLRLRGQIEGDAVLLANLRDRRLQVPNLRVSGFHAQGLLLDGETQVRGLDIFFENGVCAHAEGAIASDVLARAGRMLGFQAPELSGEARCDAGDALVALAGVAATGEQVSFDLRLQGNGAGEWRMLVHGANPEASLALAAAGFQAQAQSGVLTKGERLRWWPF